MTAQRIRDLLARERAGGEVAVEGWLRTARHGRGRSFLEVVDGSCLAGLQVVAEADLPGYEDAVRHLGTGAAVRVRGELVDSPGRGQRFEVRAREVEVVGPAGPDYPLQKKRHSFEFLRTIAHLRPRTNTLGAVFRVRNAAAMAIHRWFQERGFLWLHTPIITTSDAEGAGEMFRVTTLDPADPPRDPEGRVDEGADFFGRPAHLTVSGQLEAEIGALSHGRVYAFGPTFRAENSHTARHLAEFWMVEPEVAFLELDGLMDLAESFLRDLVAGLLAECAEDLAFFDRRIAPGLLARLREVASKPFARVSYAEAVEILARSGRAFEHEVAFGVDLKTEHERHLCEEHFRGPVVVHDYPAEIKAFYMYRNDDGRTVRAMDVLVPGVGEIIGGSQREHRLEVLRARMRECGLDPETYWGYLDLRRFGSVPHAGFGLGFERFVQYVTGMANIRDVIPFPRVPGFAEF